MGLLRPTPPPYDPIAWSELPFPERARLVCEAWALQGYGSPLGAYAFYLLKVALYVAGWFACCAASPSLGGPSTIATWWLAPLAYEKAIVWSWSMLFEVLGLGCGSGPLSGRYFPPFGGFLYFSRVGTTKRAFFPDAPIVGGDTRSFLDVAVYAALVACAVRFLIAASPGVAELAPLVVLVPLAGLLDTTLFLSARAEHFWVTIVALVFARDTIAAAKTIQLALWFWAGVSKLNHHFPTVVCVMTSNGPLTRMPWLRRFMYRDFPRDLRPARIAEVLAHVGTVLELAVPIAFLATPLGAPPLVAIALMLGLHGYITSNVPMGVPIEWNVMMVYGGFALFWAHPSTSILDVGPWPVALFVLVFAIVLPLVGNVIPSRVSFLLSMRYYAGNWPFSIWLVRKGAHVKLGALKKSSGWIYDQLARFYDHPTSVGLLGKVMGFRLMHLHGRALGPLVAKAVDTLADYEWLDGEIVAGLALGWNFGEGRLHDERLLASLQRQCGFEAGDVRCIFVEAQPLFGDALTYRIADAKTGPIDAGSVAIADLRARQPWDAPP
jgi:hypothetical protein